MRKLMLILLVSLALVMVAAVLAYQYGGILGLILAIIVIFFALRFVPKLISLLMMRWLAKSLRDQGEPLRGATIEVHDVQPADQPSPGEYQDEEFFDEEHCDWEGEGDAQDLIDPSLRDLFYHGPRKWYYIDMTIYPAMRTDGRATEYKPWMPGLVTLLGPAHPMPAGIPAGLGPLNIVDGFASVARVMHWRDDAWADNDEHELFGPQQIRLHAGVKPGENRFRVAYVGEVIGEVEITANE